MHAPIRLSRFRAPLLRVAAPLLAAIACAPATQAQPTFSLVGNPGSVVYAISADGSTLVGSEPISANISHPFKWSAAALGAGIDLGMFTPAQTGFARAVNSDGTLIVGYGSAGFRWRPSTGLSPMSSGAQPYGASSDGSVIVGRSSFGVAAIWTDILGTAATPPTLLPVVGSNSFNDAVAISADQTLVAGNAIDAGNECSLGALWAVGNGQLLAGIQTANSKAVRAMTPSGRFIVGSVGACDFFGGAGQAARWDNGIATGLGSLASRLGSIATAVSSDGSVIVGHHYNQPYGFGTPDSPFVWTQRTGRLDLRSLLDAVGTAIPSNMQLTTVTGISADGRTLVGNGSLAGVARGWTLSIDPAILGVRLLSPADGASAIASPLTLTWSPISDATSYDVTFVPSSGPSITLSTNTPSILAPAAATAQCQTVSWGVIAQTPSGPVTSFPALRTYTTLRIGDFDRNGTVAIADIFSFISAWFSGNPAADINGNGLAVSDLFDFLNQWFTGCP